jgi:fimbrial chaperone protein
MNAKSRLAGLALALGALAPGWAASLHVVPVSVQLAPGQAAATVSLRNDGDQTLRAQVRVFSWSQAGNQDHLDASQALIASPPQVEIAPKATQTVRLVRAAKTAPTGEESFRLLIDEIVDTRGRPADRRKRAAALLRARVRLAGRHEAAQGDGHHERRGPEPRAEGAERRRPARCHLRVMLQGDSGDAIVLEPGLLGYVLVGKTMEWKLPIPPRDSAKAPFTTMRCRFNGEDFSSKL